MNTAYLYIRFSSLKQAEEKGGDSLRRQTAAAQKYCKTKGLKLDNSTTFRDLGVSGFQAKNSIEGELSLFLTLCREGKIKPNSVLLIEAFDRLSRAKPTVFLRIFLDIVDAGVKIVTLAHFEEYTVDDHNKLVLAIMHGTQSHAFSALLSKRLKDKWQERRDKNKHTTTLCPGWLKYSKAKKRFVTVEDKVKTVKLMVSWAIKGHSILAIRNKLHEMNVPPMRKGPWSRTTVANILRSPALIGDFIHHIKPAGGKRQPIGDVITGYYPSVIDRPTYNKLRSVLLQRKQTHGRLGNEIANLFSGIVKNAANGFTMTYDRGFLITADTPRDKERGKVFGYQAFERAMLAFLCNDIKLGDVLKEREPGTISKCENLTNERELVRAKIADTKKYLETKQPKDPTHFLDLLSKYSDRERQLTEQLTVADYQATDRDDQTAKLTTLQKSYRTFLKADHSKEARLQLKAYIAGMVEQIWVYIIGKHKSPFKSLVVQTLFKAGGNRFVLFNIDKGTERYGVAIGKDIDFGKCDLRHLNTPDTKAILKVVQQQYDKDCERREQEQEQREQLRNKYRKRDRRSRLKATTT